MDEWDMRPLGAFPLPRAPPPVSLRAGPFVGRPLVRLRALLTCSLVLLLLALALVVGFAAAPSPGTARHEVAATRQPAVVIPEPRPLATPGPLPARSVAPPASRYRSSTTPPPRPARAHRARSAPPRTSVRRAEPATGGGLPEVMLRIRSCESGPNGYATGGRAHDYDYTAHDPRSTASGGWSFLRSTWDGYAGYWEAAAAPPAVQDRKAMLTYRASGTRPWAASQSCWG